MKSGICVNFDNCVNADNEVVLSIEEFEEFTCPECGRPLKPIVPPGCNTFMECLQKYWWILLSLLIVVLLIGFWMRNKSSAYCYNVGGKYVSLTEKEARQYGDLFLVSKVEDQSLCDKLQDCNPDSTVCCLLPNEEIARLSHCEAIEKGLEILDPNICVESIELVFDQEEAEKEARIIMSVFFRDLERLANVSGEEQTENLIQEISENFLPGATIQIQNKNKAPQEFSVTDYLYRVANYSNRYGDVKLWADSEKAFFESFQEENPELGGRMKGAFTVDQVFQAKNGIRIVYQDVTKKRIEIIASYQDYINEEGMPDVKWVYKLSNISVVEPPS